MIQRELYMSRIRPFIGTDLIKVMTGIRRCGKSVMLELIKQELIASGVNPAQFISINFENILNKRLALFFVMDLKLGLLNQRLMEDNIQNFLSGRIRGLR